MIDERNLLQIVEVIDIMEQGVTEPLKCRLSNNGIAVVKYPKNRCGTATLINEWVGNCIADLIGVPVPRYGICVLTEEVIQKANPFECIDYDNKGICFYSTYLPNTVPNLVRRQKGCFTEKIMLLDHIINHFDRNDGSLLFDMSTSLAYAIDYSHIFTKEPIPIYESDCIVKGMDDEHYLYDDILKKNEEFYRMLHIKQGFTGRLFKESAQSIKPIITDMAVDEIFEKIPADWSKTVDYSVLNQLASFIKYRAHNIESIAMMVLERRGAS